jgi:hypothetical protein
MTRSSGSGRSSIVFNESGRALINSQRLRWRLPKIIFLLNRYVICPLILCVTVTCKTCAQRLTSSNDSRWRHIRKYQLHCVSLLKTSDDPNSVLFHYFHIREYLLDHGFPACSFNPLYGFSSMYYMSLQFAMWESVRADF